MNLLLKSILLWVAGFFCFTSIVSAQTVTPVFPQQNQQIALLDLLDEGLGFQWTSSDTLTNVMLEIKNPTNAIPQLQSILIPVSKSESPFFLEETFRGRFLAGNYSWQLISDQVSSEIISFQIISAGDLRPTPAPPIEAPSGDANASSRIDKPDLYLLAANWNKNLFDENSADFNLDGTVNQKDILVMASRFGDAAVPPTPSPAVGKPGNIRFFPNDVIGFAELTNFRINWDPPQFPESELFYEMVIFSQFGQEIVSMRFLQDTQFALSSLTQSGVYDVFIRAKTGDGTLGNIANAQFEIDPSRVVTPTPNFGIVNLDFDNSGNVDLSDTRLFINAFGTFNGDDAYIPDADFNQDGIIDSDDITVYQSAFPSASDVTAAPEWNSIVRPTMDLGPGGCVLSGNSTTIALPPLDIIFAKNTCIFAELNNAQFTFNRVDGAVDYFYTIRIEGEPDPFLQGFTLDENFYTGFSILLQNTTFLLEIQSVNEGLQFSAPGQTLRFTIPAN